MNAIESERRRMRNFMTSLTPLPHGGAPDALRSSRMKRLLLAVAVSFAALSSFAAPGVVDASEAGRGVFRRYVIMRGQSGPFTCAYPKRIPAARTPTVPLTRVAGA